jgi:hypothetical protein
LTVRAQAQNSDIAIQRITLNLGSNTTIYNKIYTKFYVEDSTGAVLATVPLNSSTVVQSGNNYLLTITGFTSVVPKNTYKDFTIAADLYSAIDTTYRNNSYSISLYTQGVRGVDGAGIDQYAGDSTVSQSITINASLTDNSIANVSSNTNTPQTNSYPVTDTTNGQYQYLPVLIFDIGAQNDSLHIHQVAVNFATSSANGAPANANVTAAYLYQGSTLISSANISNTGVATFSNITDGTAGASIPVNTTVSYTVKITATNVTAGSMTITPSLNTGSTIIYNSIDANVNTFNGSAPGFASTVLGKGPAFSLAGAPVIGITGSNVSGTGSNSSSTVTATFNVNVQAVGANVYFGNQASTSPMFTFKVFNGAGTDVTSTLQGVSTGFIIPSSGVITVGVPSGSFYVPQQNSAQIANVTYKFDGKISGQNLTAGPYSVEIAGITYSIDNGTTHTTTTYMDGQSTWRTPGQNP